MLTTKHRALCWPNLTQDQSSQLAAPSTRTPLPLRQYGPCQPHFQLPPLPDSFRRHWSALICKRHEISTFSYPSFRVQDQSWLRADFDRRILLSAIRFSSYDFRLPPFRCSPPGPRHHMLLLSALILYQNVAAVRPQLPQVTFCMGHIGLLYSKKWRPIDFSARRQNWSWIPKNGYENGDFVCDITIVRSLPKVIWEQGRVAAAVPGAGWHKELRIRNVCIVFVKDTCVRKRAVF